MFLWNSNISKKKKYENPFYYKIYYPVLYYYLFYDKKIQISHNYYENLIFYRYDKRLSYIPRPINPNSKIKCQYNRHTEREREWESSIPVCVYDTSVINNNNYYYYKSLTSRLKNFFKKKSIDRLTNSVHTHIILLYIRIIIIVWTNI